MAKDPAFLFYTSDFLTGTLTMSDEQVGRYIRLLCLQHQKYELTEKDMLFICKSYDEDIYSKFKKEDGKFYNERLREESIKRSKYSESRRNNKLKKKISSTYVQHMENENENINDNINNNNGKKSKFKPPTLEQVSKFFEDNGYINADTAWNYYNDADWTDSTGKPVLNWKQKMRIVWFRDENKKKITLSLHDLDRRARELNDQILYPHEK
jgi:hypothetical protein